MTRPRSELPETLKSAEDFVEKVGELSECGVRVLVDVYDEGQTVSKARYKPLQWPDYPDVPYWPYDATFHRSPDDDGAGITNFQDAYFPVLKKQTGRDPWWGLIMHEWLHIAVNFYDEIQQGWPVDDVHGACDHPDYRDRDSGYGCMVKPAWFADLMTGRVLEGGKAKGILPHE